MRISKQVLVARWFWTSLAALALGLVLGVLDFRLRQVSGYGTADLQSLSTAAAYETVFHSWGVHAWLARAGFNLGLDYLFMAFYGTAFFCSGIIVRDAFAPRPGLLRRLLALAAMAPVAAVALDVVENALEMDLMLAGPTDGLARIAYTVSSAKTVGITIGLLLLAGAVLARVQERKKRALAGLDSGP